MLPAQAQDTSSPSSNQQQETGVDSNQADSPTKTASSAERVIACESITPSEKHNQKAYRDETVATTPPAKPQHSSEADEKGREPHNNPVSAGVGDEWVEVSHAVEATPTATTPPPRNDDGGLSSVTSDTPETTEVGGTTLTSSAVVSEQASVELPEDGVTNDRSVLEAPPSEHVEHDLATEDNIEPRENSARENPDKSSLKETSGEISKESSVVEIPNDKHESAVERVPAAVDAPNDRPQGEPIPIVSVAKSDAAHLGSSSASGSTPVAASPSVGDRDVPLPLSEESEEAAYSEFGDAEDVLERGGVMAGTGDEGNDGKAKIGDDDCREDSDKYSLHSKEEETAGTEGERREQSSLVDRTDSRKEDSFDDAKSKSGEASDSPAVIESTTADEETAVASAIPRTQSEDNAVSNQNEDEDAAVLTDATFIAGSNVVVTDGFEPEAVSKAGERSTQNPKIGLEDADEVRDTEGERQQDKLGSTSPAAAINSVGDDDSQGRRLEAPEHESGETICPLETPVPDSAVSTDTEGSKKEDVDATPGVRTDASIDGGSFRPEGTEGDAGHVSSENSANFPEGVIAATGTESTDNNNAGDPACDDERGLGGFVDRDDGVEEAEQAMVETNRVTDEGKVVLVDTCVGVVIASAVGATEVGGGASISGASPPIDRVSTNDSAAGEAFELKTPAGTTGVESEEINEDGMLAAAGQAETSKAVSREVAERAIADPKAMTSSIDGGIHQSGVTVDSGASIDNSTGWDSFEADSSEGKAEGEPPEMDADTREIENTAVVDVEELRKEGEEEKNDVVDGATVDPSVSGGVLEPEGVESTGSGSIRNTTGTADGEHTSALEKPSTKGAETESGETTGYSTDGHSLAAESTEVAVDDGALEDNAVDKSEAADNGDHKDDANGGANGAPSNETAGGIPSIGDNDQSETTGDRTQGAPQETSVDTQEGSRDVTISKAVSSNPVAESTSGGALDASIVDNSSFEAAESLQGTSVECEKNYTTAGPTVSGEFSAVERNSSFREIVGVSGATVADSIRGIGLEVKPKGPAEGGPSENVDVDISKDESSRDRGNEETEEAAAEIVSVETAEKSIVGDSIEPEGLVDGTGSGSAKKLLPQGGISADGDEAMGTDVARKCESNFGVGVDSPTNQCTLNPDSIEGVGSSDTASTASCLEADVADGTIGAAMLPPTPEATGAPAPENVVETVEAPAEEQLGDISTASVLPQLGLTNEDPEKDERIDQPFEPELVAESAAASPSAGGDIARGGVVPVGDGTPGQPTAISSPSDAKPTPSSLSTDATVGDGGGEQNEPALLAGEGAVQTMDVAPGLERVETENANTNVNAAAPLLSGGTTTGDAPIEHALDGDGASDAAGSSSTPSAHNDRDEVGDVGAVTRAEHDVVDRNVIIIVGGDGDEEKSDVESSVLVAPCSVADAAADGGVIDTVRVADSCQEGFDDKAAVGAGSTDDDADGGLECTTIDRAGDDEGAGSPAHSEQDRRIDAHATAAADSPQQLSIEHQVSAHLEEDKRIAAQDTAAPDSPQQSSIEHETSSHSAQDDRRIAAQATAAPDLQQQSSIEHKTPAHSEQDDRRVAAQATAAPDSPQQSSIEHQVAVTPATTTSTAAVDALDGDDAVVAGGGELTVANSTDTEPPPPGLPNFSSKSAIDSAQASEAPTILDASTIDPSSEAPEKRAFQAGEEVEEERGDGGGEEVKVEVEAREETGSRGVEQMIGEAGSDHGGGEKQLNEDNDCYELFDNVSSSLESLASSDHNLVVGPSKKGVGETDERWQES